MFKGAEDGLFALSLEALWMFAGDSFEQRKKFEEGSRLRASGEVRELVLNRFGGSRFLPFIQGVAIAWLCNANRAPCGVLLMLHHSLLFASLELPFALMILVLTELGVAVTASSLRAQ